MQIICAFCERPFKTPKSLKAHACKGPVCIDCKKAPRCRRSYYCSPCHRNRAVKKKFECPKCGSFVKRFNTLLLHIKADRCNSGKCQDCGAKRDTPGRGWRCTTCDMIKQRKHVRDTWRKYQEEYTKRAAQQKLRAAINNVVSRGSA